MKTKAKHSFFRRAAIALLTMVLTATTAGAQEVTFSPELQSSYTFTSYQIKPNIQSVNIDGVVYTVWKYEDAAARLKGAYIKYGENVNVGTGTVIVHAYPSDADRLQLMCQFDIVTREVTVVVDSKEKNYGDADPAFTCYLDPSTTGDVDPDTLSNWRPQLAQYVTMTREAGELPGTYAITTVKTTPFKFAGKNVVVTAVTPGTLTVTANPADWAETATDEYTIKSAAGWDVFCDLLADADGKTFFSGKTVKLGADIGSADNPITRRAGSADHDFTGHFDGQGHTLYVRLGTADAPLDAKAAPFQNVTTVNSVAASIENLHVCGDIYASGKYAAGIIGSQYGNVTLRNCRSSVNIHSSAADDTSSGGLVGNGHDNLTIEGCLFDGSLTAEAAGAIKCAGFVGYNSGTLTVSNSLVAPASVTIGTGTSGAISATFARGWSGTPANSYYTAPPSGGWGGYPGQTGPHHQGGRRERQRSPRGSGHDLRRQPHHRLQGKHREQFLHRRTPI